MNELFDKYTSKLIRDATAFPESIRFYALDDRIIASHDDEWLPVFTEVFAGLNIAALLFARPSLPFADLLIERADHGADRLVPKDSETRVFLHDIPFIRKKDWAGRPGRELAAMIVRRLRERKAALIEGLGFVATGGLTVEQAYIAYSTLFHTTFVKYLLDVLNEGFKLPNEGQLFDAFRKELPAHPDASDLAFTSGPIKGSLEIKDELCRAGRHIVEKGLVDSFFGNISYYDGKTIFISETASSLDELERHIVPVSVDGSSTAGVSASSELPAHKAIYLSSNYHAVLHGHPKFSVIMSMHCTEEGCAIEDCNRNCSRKRRVCGVPIVAGETGAGGLAKTVPNAIKESGICLVYGHGVFSAGENDFREAFMKMMEIENRCREEYFDLLKERIEL